jgi:hypothetical protein
MYPLSLWMNPWLNADLAFTQKVFDEMSVWNARLDLDGWTRTTRPLVLASLRPRTGRARVPGRHTLWGVLLVRRPVWPPHRHGSAPARGDGGRGIRGRHKAMTTRVFGSEAGRWWRLRYGSCACAHMLSVSRAQQPRPKMAKCGMCFFLKSLSVWILNGHLRYTKSFCVTLHNKSFSGCKRGGRGFI